jgi:hypothetical protein
MSPFPGPALPLPDDSALKAMPRLRAYGEENPLRVAVRATVSVSKTGRDVEALARETPPVPVDRKGAAGATRAPVTGPPRSLARLIRG